MAGVSVARNWSRIQSQVNQALFESGRPEGSVKILGVGKRQSPDRIREGVGLGLWLVGENYVQELLQKKRALRDLSLEWHFIGHLQTNKVRDLVGQVSLIHSVDRLKVATAISERAIAKGIVQDILLELNIDREPSKGGVMAEEGAALLQKLQELKGLRICGLMAMPALSSSERNIRDSFSQIRKWRDQWVQEISRGSQGHHLNELSMGTSQDFQLAIKEGATMIRLGSCLFGARE